MITPQMIAAALRAAANVFDGSATTAQTTVTAVQPAATAADPLALGGGTPAMSAAATAATAESIMALIQPHLGDEAFKLQLGAAMRQLGVNALPEAQPHQFPALYAAFERAIAAKPAAAAATSII